MSWESQRVARTQSRWTTTLAIALLAIGALVCAAGFAGETRFDVEIAPGPLQDALDRLAELTGLQILYDPPLVQGHLTPGLKGKMTPREALEKLLASTDILGKFTADDAVALYPKPPVAARARPQEMTPPVRPQTVIVSTDRAADGGYNQTRAVTALKVDADLLTAPLSL
jgi:Secretin and TonB N terminus short domain